MRIFVDMDGTLAKWNNVEFEQLFEKGYYRNLEPNEYLLNNVNNLIRQGEDIYILSAYLTESDYAKKEKQEWVKQYLPELPEEKQIFVPYGTNKAEYLKEHYSPITNEDYLIDDYTKNLLEWKEYGGTGVKYLNGINHTKGTWKGITTNGYIDTIFINAKLKAEEIDLIKFQFQGSWYDDNHQYEDYYCYAIKEGYLHQNVLTFEANKGVTNVNDIIKGIKDLVSNKEHQRKNYSITEFFEYYKEQYPTLAQCVDFEVLCKELPSNILDDIEYTVFLLKETDYVKTDIETNELNFDVDEENKLRCNADYISWYEGSISTEELINEFNLKEAGISSITNYELEEDIDI